MGKLDKRSRKGINFYGFVDKSTCKYAIPFFLFAEGIFFYHREKDSRIQRYFRISPFKKYY